MAQSPKLPYDPPFRYTRPANDLQAVFGAQIGNPRIPRAKLRQLRKKSSLRKSGPSAPAGKSAKASTVKAAKPAGAQTGGRQIQSQGEDPLSEALARRASGLVRRLRFRATGYSRGLLLSHTRRAHPGPQGRACPDHSRGTSARRHREAIEREGSLSTLSLVSRARPFH